MPFARPTLNEIITRVTDDLNTRLDGPKLRRTNNEVLARVLAGAVHMLHGQIDYLSRHYLPDSSDSEILERWANIWDIQRKPATFATGKVLFTGTVGAEIREGTVLTGENGIDYEITESIIFNSTSARLTVNCLVSGNEGNIAGNSSLVLQAPITGVNSNAVVDTEGILGGESAESDDSLRERLLTIIRNPARGGSVNDYKIWASQIDGVGRVFVTPIIQGPGTVGVSFITNDPENLIPNSTKIQEVQDYIDEVKPVTANVTVFAPQTKAVNVHISNLKPDTPEIRQAIRDEVRDVFLRESEPGGKILLSHLREAASIATGEEDHRIVSPTSDFTSTLDELLILSEVFFV